MIDELDITKNIEGLERESSDLLDVFTQTEDYISNKLMRCGHENNIGLIFRGTDLDDFNKYTNSYLKYAEDNHYFADFLRELADYIDNTQEDLDYITIKYRRDD
ncbi:MAG: hypothetical protein BZ138_08015 [Methanosphaera sp. rholeuAM270]|nr:MAG: hypothetical protein BZ138_08015 [Methanosphaera sp. rholeuAM270]